MSMDAVIYFVGLPLLGYIAGATPFGFLAGKAKGVDIRKHGSGNIGATNVLRILGKPIGVSVFLADFLKGALPVLLSVYLVGRDGVPLQAFGRDVVPVFVALATILGHNFTFWLGFKGGKGVATSAGALVALMPLALGVGAIVWGLLFFTTRYVAVASMGAALSIPVTVVVQSAAAGAVNVPKLALAVVVAAMVVVRHSSNIRRLRDGTEHRFGSGGGDRDRVEGDDDETNGS